MKNVKYQKNRWAQVFFIFNFSMLSSGVVSAQSNSPSLLINKHAESHQINKSSGLEYESVSGLSERMAGGTLTSVELVQFLLDRIEAFDKQGPALNAVLELNPDALSIAAERDAERLNGSLRGPLHGIPILLKDNIETGDTLQTSAGSPALVGLPAAQDADVVRKLREAGAIILGKANMSEWMGFRGTNVPDGWSGRGGKSLNPHVLQADTCGSSSGSAVGVAAGLVPLSVGTETNGSITCPAFTNGVVGFKPTQGLINLAGIVPLSIKQDTVGAIARNVSDAAVLMTAMQDASDGDTTTAPAVDYVAGLNSLALEGKRIGYSNRFVPGSVDWINNPDFVASLDILQNAGATLVPVQAPTAQLGNYFEFMAMEFNLSVSNYLQKRQGVQVKSLEQLVAYNELNPGEGNYNQELIKMAHYLPVDPVRYEQLWDGIYAFHNQGVDAVLSAHSLDAMIDVPNSMARSISPIAGYPSVSVPSGMDSDGLPTGLYFYADKGSDSQLLAMAYAYEQLNPARQNPAFNSISSKGVSNNTNLPVSLSSFNIKDVLESKD